ncbi:MAG: DMT family transporter [Pikeienuella sp.]|uniref:DMT family transporter n=1 Tax=Pikeienuella sp. TaxID=2831957 RepID=UPI00391C02A8
MGGGSRYGTALIVLAVGLLWGLNWPAVKFMMTELPPLTVRALAFPMAACLLALVALALGHRLLPPREEIPALVRTGLLSVFAFNALTSIGQTLTEASKAAIVAYTMPALTAVLAAFFLGERLTGRRVAALGIGLAGLAALGWGSYAQVAAAPAGLLVMLLAAFCWALGNVSMKARNWALSPLARTVWFFVVSTAAIWPVVLMLEEPWTVPLPSAPVLATLAFHVLGPMVVSYTLFAVLVGRLPASVAAIATLTAPVVGVLSSILFLGEAATAAKAVALLLIVASIAMTLAPRRGAS